ncbi:unnamed protein product [Cylicostephanus goldi]|uniref:Conserved oligomeric Golgi complex subunit 6 n=1 Tax=Cylicostephanus goldi TaxID=71465 RepID=A0A3P7M854_CYLGO|nr:unnamed protein product [Cylicostephanus goldi]
METEVDSKPASTQPAANAPVDGPNSVTNPIKRKIDKLVASKLHNDPVNAHVQDFAEKVRTMHRICSDLTNRIQQNKEKTQDLLSKTSALQNQKIVLEFSAHGTINSDFFPALARAREIYNDSKELLRSNGEHSAAWLRVEQALAGETDSVVLYRLSALFTFYSEKMTPEIGPESELSRTIDELNQLTLNIFYSGLNGAVQKILSKMGAPDYDLLPVPAVHQILMLLRYGSLPLTFLSNTAFRDVLETHDGAMAGRTNSEEEFNKIFSCVLDPLYRSVQVAATHLHSPLGNLCFKMVSQVYKYPLDVAVYTLNCLSAIHSLVILYPFTDSRLEMIKALVSNEDVLVSEEASTILANTGLIHLYQKASAHDKNQGPLSAISGMDSATVNNTLIQFDAYLAQPDKYQLDQVAKISSARTRESVKQRTVDNVVAAYSAVIKKLEDPANAYENVSYKSVDQICSRCMKFHYSSNMVYTCLQSLFVRLLNARVLVREKRLIEIRKTKQYSPVKLKENELKKN